MSLLLILEILAALFVILLTAFLSYWVYFYNNHYWVDKNIKFQKTIPLLGTIYPFLSGKSIHGVDQELYQKYGKLFGAFVGVEPILYIGEPELLKLVFVKDFNIFPNRRVFLTGIPMVDNMITAVTGERWKNLRSTISPAFSSGKLKSMIPIISDCAKISTDNFCKYVNGEKGANCKKLYGNFTLDVIANIAFGTRLDSHNDPDNKFVAHASKFFSNEIDFKTIIGFFCPKLAKVFGISFFPSDSIEFFTETTNSIIQRREENNEVRPDFLQIMIDSQKIQEQTINTDLQDNNGKTNVEKVEQIKRKPLTKEEALAQCILFFIGGFDSTSTTLSMVSYYLALNPGVQDKVLEEVDRIWEKRDTLDSEAIFEAKYIEAVIDETLRLCPPAVRLERTAEKDYVVGDTGVRLKKGMVVVIPVYVLHHDPELFPEPEKFRPERFLPKDNNEVQPYTYFPFGAGPRNCVAMRLAMMEVKLCLLHVLRRVKFSTCAETMIPMIFSKTSVLLQPKNVVLNVSLRS